MALSYIVVLDIGAYEMKFGIHTMEKPLTVRTLIHADTKEIAKERDVKRQTNRKEENRLYQNLIEHGRVTSFKGLENFLSYAFKKLNVESKYCNVFLCEPIPAYKADKVKIRKMLYDKFEVYGISSGQSSLLALACPHRKDRRGRVFGMAATGVIVDSGYDDTYIVPMIDGCIREGNQNGTGHGNMANGNNPHFKLGIGGKHLSKHLQGMQDIKNHPYRITNWQTEELKHSPHCVVALDYDKERHGIHFREQQERKQGIKSHFGLEAIACAEALFQPRLADKTAFDGKAYHLFDLPQKIKVIVDQFDYEVQREMLRNVILVGGNMKFRNMYPRLFEELKLMYAEDVDLRISMPSDPRYGMWQGAAFLCHSRDFKKTLYLRKRYLLSGKVMKS